MTRWPCSRWIEKEEEEEEGELEMRTQVEKECFNDGCRAQHNIFSLWIMRQDKGCSDRDNSSSGQSLGG